MDINKYIQEKYVASKPLDESYAVRFANRLKHLLIDSECDFISITDRETGEETGASMRDEYRVLYETFLDDVELLVEKACGETEFYED